LVTFEISNLARSVWVRGWGMMGPIRAMMSDPGRFRAGDVKMVRLGKVFFKLGCQVLP